MRQLLFFLASIFVISTYAQDVALDGYVFESGNRGYLNSVQITVKDTQTKQAFTTTSSDKEGHFSVRLPVGEFILVIEKDLFHPIQKTIKIDGTVPKVFEKIQMERKPGYILDATLAEKRTNSTKQVDAITNSLIEVFNNTKDELVLILEGHPYPTFKTTFERGNHYTVLIRKEGYVPKRLEAYVDIKGCILCFDGAGSIQPGISDVLTESNQMGTFLANIELERLTAKNKSKVVYGEESLVEILFMENLNSEIVEVGTDGRVKSTTTINNKTHQPSSIKVGKDAASTFQTGVVNTSTGTSQSPSTQSTFQTESVKNKETITGIVTAPSPPTSKAKPTTTKVETTAKSNTVKKPVVTRPKPTPEPTVVNTAQPSKSINQSTNSATIPDYKKTSSSTNTILSRGNRGETLVKTATSKPAKQSKPATVEKPLPSSTTTSINSQGESLVQTATTQNSAEFIEANYTGYLIEILLSTKEVAKDNPIFKQHGQVKKELRSDGGYSYLLGDFNKKKEASTFLKEVVRDRYPMAKVVYYMNGEFVGYVFIPRSKGDNSQPR